MKGHLHMKSLSALAVLLCLTFALSGPSYGQGCYGNSSLSGVAYQAAPQVSTQTFHIPVTVSVVTQPAVVEAAPQALAVPQCQAQAFALPQSYAVPSCNPVGLSLGTGINYSYGVGYGGVGLVGVNRGFVNRGFVRGNFGQFGAVSVGGVGNVAISAADRRGTQVQAVGVNNVRVNRGLLGRINSVQADGRPPGLLGRLGL
jgi:F0F1-type ATP synthase membrane subunit c/vacuolar-type H+-ATPase subunit K